MKALSAILWAAWVALAPTNAIAGDDLPPDFKAWWERITAGGADGPNWDGISLKYRVEFLHVPPEAELAEMKARVEGKPYHPDRSLLETYERRKSATTPDAIECQVWRWRGEWRNSRLWRYPHDQYTDFAWSRDGAWQLSEGMLVVVPPDAKSEDAQAIAVDSSGATLEMSMFISAGLISAPALGISLEPRLVSSERWVAEDSRRDKDSDCRLRAEGRWLGEGRGTVDRCVVEVRRPADAKPVIEACVAENWQNQPLVGHMLASVVTQYNTLGQPEKRYVLTEVQRFTETTFRDLVRVPRLDREDPIRGKTTFTSLRDLRPDADAFWASQGLAVSSRLTDEQERMNWLRAGGWILAGILVVMLVLLRARHGGAFQISWKSQTTMKGGRE
jgi:hypothetical protein